MPLVIQSTSVLKYHLDSFNQFLSGKSVGSFVVLKANVIISHSALTQIWSCHFEYIMLTIVWKDERSVIICFLVLILDTDSIMIKHVSHSKIFYLVPGSEQKNTNYIVIFFKIHTCFLNGIKFKKKNGTIMFSMLLNDTKKLISIKELTQVYTT